MHTPQRNNFKVRSKNKKSGKIHIHQLVGVILFFSFSAPNPATTCKVLLSQGRAVKSCCSGCFPDHIRLFFLHQFCMYRPQNEVLPQIFTWVALFGGINIDPVLYWKHRMNKLGPKKLFSSLWLRFSWGERFQRRQECGQPTLENFFCAFGATEALKWKCWDFFFGTRWNKSSTPLYTVCQLEYINLNDSCWRVLSLRILSSFILYIISFTSLGCELTLGSRSIQSVSWSVPPRR